MSEAMVLITLKRQVEMKQALEKVLIDISAFPKLSDELVRKAGQEFYPQGITMILVLAIHDQVAELAGIDHPYSNTLFMSGERLIEAIVEGDPSQAVQYWRLARSQAMNEAAANAQPANADSMNSEYFRAMQDVARIIHQAAISAGWYLAEQRDEDVNAFYGQLTQGMIIEFSYGSPHNIKTPLGDWSMAGSAGGSNNQLDNMLEMVFGNPHLKLELFKEQRDTEMGSFGPWYAVRKVGGFELPEPVYREKAQYIDSDVAKKRWEELSTEYLLSQVFKGGVHCSVKGWSQHEVTRSLNKQKVIIHAFHEDGMAEVSIVGDEPAKTYRLPVIDLYLFKSGVIA